MLRVEWDVWLQCDMLQYFGAPGLCRQVCSLNGQASGRQGFWAFWGFVPVELNGMAFDGLAALRRCWRVRLHRSD